MIIPIGTREFPVRRAFPWLTVMLFGLNCAVFAYEFYIQQIYGAGALSNLVDQYGAVPAVISAGMRPWTLITGLFFHAGLLHLASNMVFLLTFGDNVEDQLGGWRYLMLYFASGILSSMAQVFVGPSLLVPTIGASGAIAGVLAAYIVLFPRGEVRSIFFLGFLPIPLRFSAWLFVGVWFIIQLFNGVAGLGVATTQDTGVAYFAHIGGFIAGLWLARLLRPHQISPVDDSVPLE